MGTGQTETWRKAHESCPKQVVLGLENGVKSSLYDLTITGVEKTNAGWRAPMCT